LKTQELYALVFLTRYVDLLFTNPLRSPLTTYNTIMKILFISTSLYIVHQMRTRYKHTYNEAADAFRVPFLIGPAAVAALLFHLKNTVVEVVWAFSIFLEAVAIMPQLFLLQKTGEVENITGHYIFALGAYRGLYALNWVWRAFWEPGYRQWLAWTAGIVQTGLYADFFYHYIRRYVSGCCGGVRVRGVAARPHSHLVGRRDFAFVERVLRRVGRSCAIGRVVHSRVIRGEGRVVAASCEAPLADPGW